jgi:hypothetical protein
LDEVLMVFRSKGFRKDVGYLIFAGDVTDFHFPVLDEMTDLVISDVDVL